MSADKNKIGLWTATSLVIGNMIASGLFMLPATLGIYGGISLVGWVISGLGAICLALVFSWLSKLKPLATGGPYAYSREGMGDFAAFLVAWGYWISVWCTNAAIAVAFVSYLTAFIPALATHPVYAVGTGFLLSGF
ncbi:MAG: amino acid permease [Cytophagales bacterium]|nr:amino acid permease [Cytophagales bacterium]